MFPTFQMPSFNPLDLFGGAALADMYKQSLSQAFVSSIASGLNVPISFKQPSPLLNNNAVFGFLNNATGEFTKLSNPNLSSWF